ncbi:MAG: MOSC domain-containing protein [Lysobacteraceae bacterium]|nr:MAG: MOSC domain-containing protein [Xanthomonadaceae bacterium]
MKTKPRVLAVHASAAHAFSKDSAPQIELIEGLGVAGDAHCGATVKHRSRVARNPNQPNLRQVHLMHAELFGELARAGFDVAPGQLGENITTEGLALLDLPEGTALHIGPSAVVRLTGLRNPCFQIDKFQRGLMQAVLDRDAKGRLVRKAGVMAVVLAGGVVQAGDAIRVELPRGSHDPLQPV